MSADRAIALLLVSADGTILRANPAAAELLGGVPGHRCADVVGLAGADGTRHCTPTCAAALHRAAAPAVERRGTLRNGRPATVVCGRLGDDVLVDVVCDRRKRWVAERLTPREIEVLRLVAAGLTSPMICKRLRLRPATVRTHLEHVREKLGVHTRAEAVARATTLGLLGSD